MLPRDTEVKILTRGMKKHLSGTWRIKPSCRTTKTKVTVAKSDPRQQVTLTAVTARENVKNFATAKFHSRKG